jgi:hypothetical protein
MPSGIRGMTALDFAPGTSRELGIAGALGQIWHWEKGGFTEKIDASSPPEKIKSRHLFRFRVREVRWHPRGENLQAYAVTSGCCSGSPVDDAPRLLTYADGLILSGGKSFTGWFVRSFGSDPTNRGNDNAEAHGVGLPSPWRTNLADSLYSFVMDPGAATWSQDCITGIFAPGGPQTSDEPTSASGNICVQQSGDTMPRGFGVLAPAPDLSLGAMRLVSAEGPGNRWTTDVADAIEGRYHTYRNAGVTWAVGELPDEAEPGLPGPGLLAGSRARPAMQLAEPLPKASDPGTYQPPGQKELAKKVESAYYRAETYRLNAVDLPPGGNGGWAAGDFGALLSLEQTTQAFDVEEPPEPELGAGDPRPLPDNEAYDPYRPQTETTDPAPVPSLASSPLADVDDPLLEPFGAPPGTSEEEAVAQIAMSRDGTEGWTVGAPNPSGVGPRRTVLFRYEGAAWRRCEIVGIAGQLRPDPACEGLEGLLDFPTDAGQRQTVILTAITRVPLERDGDPDNDDEFEAVAAGSRYRYPGRQELIPTILRYRNGRWQLEDTAAVAALDPAVGETPRSLAFTAPDDGWLLLGESSIEKLYRYDGTRWIDCDDEPGPCGNVRARMPAFQAVPLPDEVDVTGLTADSERVYAFGRRYPTGRTNAAAPMIVYRERGGVWEADPAKGGWDPSFGNADTGPENEGFVSGMTVAGDGRTGWALGRFGTEPALELAGGGWTPRPADGPLRDYLQAPAIGAFEPIGGEERMALAPSENGPPEAFAADGNGRLFRFDPATERWRLAHTTRPSQSLFAPAVDGEIQAIAPDGRGGVWAAVQPGTAAGSSDKPVSFYRYSPRAPKPPFEDVGHPVREGVTALAAGRDGTVWAGTGSDRLYRYDRLTGWDAARIPGWDFGTTVTRPSPVNAIAIGADGDGVAVGDGGRIARLGADLIGLDPAAGTRCAGAAPGSPCGTTHDLHAAAVAPGGSALAGGDGMSLVWRPARSAPFQPAARPQANGQTRITGVTMPEPDQAWMVTSSGTVFAGQLEDEAWRWRQEARDAGGRPFSVQGDRGGEAFGLRAVAVAASGHGYAVGDNGLMLVRDGERWRRVPPVTGTDLHAVTVAPDGRAALVGGEDGLILTGYDGRFAAARSADPFARERVVGLALLPGTGAGTTEAWAAVAGPTAPADRILHYTSDPDDPMTNPGPRAEPLPDAPAPRPGELSFAAFGKSDCPGSEICPEPNAGSLWHEVLLRRTVRALRDAAGRDAGPDFALFTGDAVDSASSPGSDAAPPTLTTRGPLKLRRWKEAVEPLDDAGLPLWAAVGGLDLSEVMACDPLGFSYALANCPRSRDHARVGDNLSWRQAFAGRAAPWGTNERPVEHAGLTFRPVPGGSLAGTALAGARTHYAVDIFAGERPAARLVVADTSTRTLTGADALQNPVEPRGQTAWLQEVLCFEGDPPTPTDRCTREQGQPAIVLSNTPTFSYGPGAGTDTQTDAAAFEALLLRYRATVAVAGRIGWNGRYWATAPGLHEPCPGEQYRDAPPADGMRVCGQSGTGVAATGVAPAADAVAAQLDPSAAPAAPVADPQALLESAGAAGLLPFVVASGAGGPLADDQGSASNGFWHGYTLVRMHASGDPRAVVVEQRPVLDWLHLSAQTRVLRPGQKVTLRGVGREPVGQPGLGLQTRYNRIDSPAITHRYDLVLADPENPSLPVRDAGGDYVPVPAAIGQVESQTGAVRAGRGGSGRTYAVAILSVGELAATYPMVFEPRRSFAAARPKVQLPLPVRPARVLPAAQPVRAPEPPPPPPPPPGTPPSPLNAQTLQPPTPPQFPTLAAAQPQVTPQAPSFNAPPPPPPPPPAPAPPAQAQPQPLALGAKPQAISIVPSVNPPAPPPVNPAPPAGGAARKEAKQKQAAVAKSEEGGEGDGAGQGAGIDVGQGQVGGTPDGAQATRRGVDRPAPSSGTNAYTRRGRDRPVASFSSLERSASASWSRGPLYAGGLALAALALSLGVGRAGPRRRAPRVPAPARARIRG